MTAMPKIIIKFNIFETDRMIAYLFKTQHGPEWLNLFSMSQQF